MFRPVKNESLKLSFQNALAMSDVDSLEKEISEFHINRDLISEQLESTQALLDGPIASSLSVESSEELKQKLQLPTLTKAIKRLYRGNETGSKDDSKPCIIIVGQTKSGKSSFINELLGGTFVAQSQSPCTARVTRLTYSDRIYVLVRSKTGEQIGDVQYLEKPTIEEDLVKLKDEDRENDELISSTVEAGIKCEFLRHGIDIIDSPGLNENSSLDSLTLGAIDSFLPINHLRHRLELGHHNCQIGAEVFYLITKMDVSRETAVESSSTTEQIEEEKAERVFSKLQRLGYISPNETRDTCNKFLCVSCWEVRRFRRKKELMIKKNKLDPEALKEMENSKWVRRFEEVKTRILKFAQDQFRNLIVSSGGGLRRIQSEILTLFMDKATNIKESNLRKKKALYQIKSLEQETTSSLRASWRKIETSCLFFAERKPLILDEVRALKYSESVISADMSQKDIEKKCVDEIHALINDRIIASFCDFLKDGALKTCQNDFDRSVSKENLVDCLITSLNGWFENQHREFVEKITSSEQLVEKSMKLTEKERSDIKALYPRVARLHLLTMDVTSKYKFRGFRIDTEGKLGSAAQCDMFRVLNEIGEPTLAAKRIISCETSLDDIATEVYHSSAFEHPNLVHVVGVRLHKRRPEENWYTVEIYMELMLCDAWTLMQRYSLPVKQRLKIGLRIATSLQFLHSSELVHQDVALSNVWVNEDLNKVKLAPFGIVKCYSHNNQQTTSIPVYLAPEIATGRSSPDASTDVFSLGIALWYLFEGTGRRHPEYVELLPSFGPIQLPGAQDRRPKRLPGMPDQLWSLMERCWSGTPDSRPSAESAADSLRQIVDSLN
uniref:Protein kinase domain-containing protein n=1 Tax=Macrostomum lignano TaxID=282301 RepID=A0A1I8G7C2_9PLAT